MKKLFFALISLLFFASNVFAADCKSENLQEDAFTVELNQNPKKEYSFGNRSVKHIYFDAKRQVCGAGELIVEQKIGNSYSKVWSGNPGKITATFLGIETKVDYVTYDAPISPEATAIRFRNPSPNTLSKYIKNIFLVYTPDQLAIPTAPINFVNGVKEQTINIEYSALTSNLTAELEKADGILTLGTSTSSVNVANAGCSYGTVGLTVRQNPINCSDYTNKIIFKQNGTTVATINVSSTYNRYVRMNTNDINFTDIKPGEESEKVIGIAYAYQSENVIATLENADSPFSLSTAIVAKGDCSVGEIPLTLTYKPTDCNNHTNKIIFTQGGKTIATINVGSTYNRYVNMNTDDINFTDIKPGEESKKVIGIDYAYQSENVIATLEKPDSPFSLSTAIVAKGDCSVGEIPLTLTYNPTDCNNHTNKIIFTQGGETIATINVGSTYNRYVDMKTDDISFLPTMELGTHRTSSVYVSYAFISEDLTATLENADSPFSLSTPTAASASSVTVAENNCTVGETTLTITFDPKATGIYSNVIQLSNGNSIKLYGECSKNVRTQFSVKESSYTSINLEWDRVQEDDLSGYRLINETTGIVYLVDKNQTSFNVTGLEMNKEYTFVLYPLFNDLPSFSPSVINGKTDYMKDVEFKSCILYQYDDERNYGAWRSSDDKLGRVIYEFPDVSPYTKKITFEARRESGSVLGNDIYKYGDDMYIFVRNTNGEYHRLDTWNGKKVNLPTTYSGTYEVEIPHNTTAIMFTNDVNNGTLGRLVRNFKVYQDNILETAKENLTIDFGEVVLGTVSEPTKFNISYANATDLKAIENSEFFTVSFDDKSACDYGETTISVTFEPYDCRDNYETSLTLFNGQELSITLKGRVKKSEEEVKKIIWNGTTSTDWDNRDNWIKEDGSQLLCADRLSKNLTVILPAPKSTKYKVPVDGITKYPIVPDVSTEDKFFKDRNNLWNGNQVNAGDNATATMIADKIYMENGASLVGVETLNQDVPRYSEVEMEFTARRHDWLLVGSVVKPWDEANQGETRNVESGDYFLYDMPHVYMHKAEANRINNEIEVSWHNSFPSLEVKLNSEEAFAIRVPDQYGRNLDYLGIMKLNKLPAEVYNSLFLKEGDTPYDGNAPHIYTFKGRFYNENSLPTYTLPGNNQPIILSNTYPANIDGQKLQTGLNHPIYYYDDENKSFKVLGTDNKSIMAQHSFVVVSGDDVETIEIKKEWFETSGTEYRNTSATIESFRVEITNNTTSSASDIYVCYDELKDEEANNVLDAPKIFNKMETSLADLYIIGDSKKWSGLVVPTLTEPIALGINVNSADQSFTFSLKKSTLSADVILEDRFTNTKYNLSEGEICLVEGLQAGACEGRFYLLLAEQEVEEDPEISTDVEENLKGGIDIYSQGNSVVVSSTSDIELMQVVVSDIAGRSQVYNVSGQYTQLTLPVNNGVYTISVIGDKATKVEKIKLN